MLTHTDWTLTMSLDLEAEGLIFKTIIAPNKWLAIGLANNLLNADIIKWVSGPEGEEMQEKSSGSDQITVNGILLPTNDHDHLRVTMVTDEEQNKIEFTTLRAFDTKDPLDTVVKLDSLFKLSIASGETSTTEWESKKDHGRIELFLS